MPRRGIVRTAARTAAIAGTATAASVAVNKRMTGGNQPSPPPAEQLAPGSAPTTATGASQDRIGALKQLAELHDSGVLTDAEFEAEKQRILAS